ncbi:PREDICTED: low-density lipoprotein receptor-related protein 1B-like [Priapulus caudatus]|uniref:Low-density lipoprotein receptor-related protein 1B-like n=1 Tax=Priapulus caudatus TaxID=37621 RepID=A0ABM1E4G9_PRICU|nr:PREDICTED: low-density lipoprotein receptor-related protein 1B-like [Priapulus caudatus]
MLYAPCEQICIDLGGSSYRCECEPGFELQTDGKHCRSTPTTTPPPFRTRYPIGDTYCMLFAPCEQICIDLRGGSSYRCECEPGFELQTDGKNCRSTPTTTPPPIRTRYPIGDTYCMLFAPCEQICIDLGGSSYRCDCEPGFELQTDGTTCRGTPTTTPPITRPTTRYPIGDTYCMLFAPCEQICIDLDGGSSYRCDCELGFKLQSDGSTCRASAMNAERTKSIVERLPLAKGVECKADQFRCVSDDCIPTTWRCDGHQDCVDASDELNCTETCPPNMWLCHNGEHCIPIPWLCDGESDCIDDSDEANCCKESSDTGGAEIARDEDTAGTHDVTGHREKEPTGEQRTEFRDSQTETRTRQ